MRTRRLAAIAALLAVAWTALWPLVSSARMLAAEPEMPLCHQAGTQVTPEQAPRDENGVAKPHCPLCIMSFVVAFHVPVALPGTSAVGALEPATHCAPAPGGVASFTPPSRAPPRIS